MKTKLELIDLGDAVKETKQWLPYPWYMDNVYYLGAFPDL
jgi:hypothetical protein